MKPEYIEPFIDATSSVFSMMLGCEVTRGEVSAGSQSHPDHSIMGIIGISGDVAGTLILSLRDETALCATEALLGERPADVSDDVLDAVGEVTNMIAGSAKSQMKGVSANISLPNVIVGSEHRIKFPSKLTPISINFDSQWGSLTIEVGLIEEAERAQVKV